MSISVVCLLVDEHHITNFKRCLIQRGVELMLTGKGGALFHNEALLAQYRTISAKKDAGTGSSQGNKKSDMGSKKENKDDNKYGKKETKGGKKEAKKEDKGHKKGDKKENQGGQKVATASKFKFPSESQCCICIVPSEYDCGDVGAGLSQGSMFAKMLV